MQANPDPADVLARLFARAEGVPVPVAAVGCVAGTLLIAVVDSRVTPLLALSVFYLLPTLGAASRDLRLGAFLAAFTAATWCAVDLFKHGSVYPSPLVPVANALSRLVVLTIVVLLVTALRRDRQRQADLARRDPLTGLANARSFHEAIEYARLVQARTRQPVTLAYLDLDDFKAVNDHLGHAAGDQVLRDTGAVLAAAVRQVDTVARLGGDEFAVLMPGTSQQQAEAALGRVHDQLTRALPTAPARAQGVTAQDGLHVSIGAVTFAEPVGSVDAMISAADDVMYEVKRSGKNRVLVAAR